MLILPSSAAAANLHLEGCDEGEPPWYSDLLAPDNPLQLCPEQLLLLPLLPSSSWAHSLLASRLCTPGPNSPLRKADTGCKESGYFQNNIRASFDMLMLSASYWISINPNKP